MPNDIQITRVTPSKISFLYLGQEYTITGEASFVHHEESPDWLADISSIRKKIPSQLGMISEEDIALITRQLASQMAQRGMTIGFQP